MKLNHSQVLFFLIFGASVAIVVNSSSVYRYQQDNGRFFSYQNDDGQFHLGNWTKDNVTTGSFGWVDSNGIETALDFIADHMGYRIIKKRSNFTRITRQPNEGIEEDPNDPDHAVVLRHFKFITANGFRVEEKRKSGMVYGKYGYEDANGRLIVVHYAAHKQRGFLPLTEIFDPKHGQHRTMSEVYKLPLRDVPNEKGLRDYYRSAREE